MSSNEEKKEKVIHTRIPAALEEQIKRLAEGLRVPVSNLVRNMLEDAIDMTRRVRQDIAAAAAPPAVAGAADLSDVFGWQSLTLNMEAPCARCGRGLAAGEDAFLGMTDRPRDRRVFLCAPCLPKPRKINATSTK